MNIVYFASARISPRVHKSSIDIVRAELERVQSGRRSEEKRTVEVTKEKSIKVTVKVQVPVREHPKVRYFVLIMLNNLTNCMNNAKHTLMFVIRRNE
jgi:hypothetical protein